MFVYFAKNLYTSLMKDHFVLIPNMHDSANFDNSTKYMGFGKTKGSVLYAVIIVNLDCITFEEFTKVLDDYEKNFTKMNMRNIMAYHVLVSSCIDEDIKLLVTSTADFFDQQLLNMYWAVDITTKSIYSKEMDDFIDIKSHIEYGLNDNDSLAVPEPFKDIRQRGILLNTVRPVTNKNTVVVCIISIFAILTISMQLSGGSQNIDILIQYGALVPSRVFYYNEHFRLLTTTFLHSGTHHLIFNGLSLYAFGTLTERYFGVAKFVVIYLFSGLIASLFTLFFVDAVSVGASGAIFGLMGSLLAITKKTGKSVSNFSSYTLALFIIFTLGFSLLIPNVGHIAHISGLITGYALGFALYKPLEDLKS